MPKVIGLKLTDGELAAWTLLAEKEGLTLTKWIRQRVNQPLASHPLVVELKKALPPMPSLAVDFHSGPLPLARPPIGTFPKRCPRNQCARPKACEGLFGKCAVVEGVVR